MYIKYMYNALHKHNTDYYGIHEQWKGWGYEQLHSHLNLMVPMGFQQKVT